MRDREQLMRTALVALLISVAAAGCGSSGAAGSSATQSGSTAQSSTQPVSTAPITTAPPAPSQMTRSSLVACLTKAGSKPKPRKEVGFAPPGGALTVGSGNNLLVVGVFPNAAYAKAAGNNVATIAASYVGKPTAEKNTHVTGTVVWFPAQSPYTGQHLVALDGCLAA